MMPDAEYRPLIVFTALGPLAVGGLAGVLWARDSRPLGLDWGGLTILAIALFALLASTQHLGRPLHGYWALARISTSWLSREVVLFGCFVILLAVYAVPVFRLAPAALTWLGGLACVVGALGVCATGQVYRLAARPVWNHGRTIAALLLGALGAGLPLGMCLAGGDRGSLAAIGSIALLLGAALTAQRARRPEGKSTEEFAAWELLVGSCRWLLTLRIAGALSAAGLLMLPGWPAAVAWVPALIGELADRTLFFQSGVPVSVTRRAGILPFDPVKPAASRP